MKTNRFITLALVAIGGAVACQPKERATPVLEGAPAALEVRAMQVVSVWRAGLDTLAWRVARLDSAARALDTPASITHARVMFAESRRAFKQVEIGLEYYAPSTTRAMNGPALPEVEETEGPEVVLAPTGFQVIEELLYDADPCSHKESLGQEIAVLQATVTRARTMMSAQQSTDNRIWDAAKLEVARIVSLGITGFDSPVAGLSLPEADAALDGIARALAPYRTSDRVWTRFDSLLSGASRMLADATDRDRFDYLGFVTRYANPLARTLHEARTALAIDVPVDRRGFAMNAATLFDTNAFDVLAFAPIDVKSEPAARVTLGRQLFHDTRLSGARQIACSSCHIPERAFTDGVAKSKGRTGQPLPRNTPTIINIGLQLGSFSDLRTTYLEDQVTAVVENADEMHAKLSDVATLLRRDAGLTDAFRAAFPDEQSASDSLVTGARIRQALAAYMRSLTRLDSPVDRALRGDTTALDRVERQGLTLFVGKGKCATCHFLPLTNGTLPPIYQKSDVEVLGTPTRPDTVRARIDPDEGRFRITHAAPHRYAFRTPSLRNVALTAPYMHNGAFPTLESVIDFYNRGGGAGIGIALEYQTLPPDRLRLTANEQRALVRFLRALTDTTGTQRR